MPPVPLPMRIVLTWAVILPLVLAVRAAVSPLLGSLPDQVALAVTVTVVVPLAVGWAVPQLTRLYLTLTRGSATGQQ